MSPPLPTEIRVIDSHTAGEPTRIIYEGGPDLGTGSLAEKAERFRSQFDFVRRGVVMEPRGSDVWVGGLVCTPSDQSCTVGVIFFNNQGYLGMCGHGLIGLMVTLKYLRRISTGINRIETPVGVVTAELMETGEVTFQNVDSFRYKASVEIDVPGFGQVVGDVAWGGNWFYLTQADNNSLHVENAQGLTQKALAIRSELANRRITGVGGATIDHVELFSSPHDAGNHSRNFVLCPGGAYDRSPCGTGTSAKLACLAADGTLQPGEIWRQESIIGSVFSGSYQLRESRDSLIAGDCGPAIVPAIAGRAHIISESNLKFDPQDQFAYGISSDQRQ